jgi:hypothetical protein
MASAPPTSDPIHVVIDDDTETVHVDPETGTVTEKQPDGGVVVHLDARKPKADDDEGGEWFANLVDEIGASELGQIANELYEQIEADDNSRQGHLEIRARGLDLLGTELKEPKAGIGDSSTAGEGMSTVTNPLMLDCLLHAWANDVGEFLPANGPWKIKVDGEETVAEDDLAEALERDMNHYSTQIATEYYPDTSHMLLWGVDFGGSGFKKVYRCPMRRRPVSESVDEKDLIVSDTTKDLRSCARITHEIKMRPSVMKRMMLLGAYRDVALTQPTVSTNVVEQKEGAIQGTQTHSQRPEDQPYNVWETQCELDLGQFVPAGSDFKDAGIPLPFLVTMDKDSREILSLRRDWDEDNDQCERKRMYVKYPYIPGPGFYGTGILNILGNATAAMTAAWREALDAGMFASFPGGLIAKSAVRQNTAIFRPAPGQFEPIETSGQAIGNIVMGMPYKDVTPGLMALMDKIQAQAQRVGGAAEIPSAEGIQNVPVGTMLAQIEQATKVIAAAHKGKHTAQAEELALILDVFRAHPEDFCRYNKSFPKGGWDEQKFLQALNDHKLAPVSDPNVPSHIHRVAKALALIQLLAVQAIAPFMNAKEVLLRCLRAIREDPTGLVVDPPPMPQGGPPQDPAKMIAAQAAQKNAETKAQEAQTKAAQGQTDAQLEAAKVQTEKEIAQTNLQREVVIHAHDADREAQAQAHDQGLAAAQHALAERQQTHAEVESAREHALDTAQAGREHTVSAVKTAHEMGMAERDRELADKQHQLDVKQANKPEPKPAPAKPKGKT